MKNYFTTERLQIGPLTNKNAEFILELVNTPGWLKFIGDRNVKNVTDAKAYIKKIVQLPNVKYWVVYTRDNNKAVGIITFIKRDYLEHHDIGFAFLQEFTKLGYAFEAASSVLNYLQTGPCFNVILATTLQDNHSSIALLDKLNFRFEKQIAVDGLTLQIYQRYFEAAGS
jgi:[ribosomal protein S5]-alanine N-acetyltransferase